MKNILKILGLSFVILALFAACDNHFTADSNAAGKVVIRLAGSNARTIMPSTPVFSRYELVLQKGNEVIKPEADNVTGAGVVVTLAIGEWTITLNAYQEINGKEFLAAQGTYALTVRSDQDSYTIEMELNPVSIEDAVGVFSFVITLPADADTAILSLIKDDAEIEVIDLKDAAAGTVAIGTVELTAGYYDLSIILTKGEGQYAGRFESVHIYAGLESAAEMDLSNIEFAEKVYLAGKLGGIRIGTVKIAYDEDGFDVIKEIELERNTLVRSDFWFAEIQASYVGKKLFIILEFNGEKTAVEISRLESKGSAGVNLDLIPQSARYINLAEWYSVLTAGETEITVDFGFDVTANFVKLLFDDGSNSFKYFQDAIIASVFNSGDFRDGNSLPVAGFELYNAADRRALIGAIASAQNNCDVTAVSANGEEIIFSVKWVTDEVKAVYQTAIDAAKAALDDPMLTDADVAALEESVADADAVFNAAKKWGRDTQISADDFVVSDGYARKYVIQLKNIHPLFKYQIYMSDSAGSDGALISEKTVNEAGDISFEVEAAPGITRYFNVKVLFTEDSNREIENIKIGPCKTLGDSIIWLAPGYSYSTLTAVWTPAQMADVYRVIYMYAHKAADGWIDAVWTSADAFERDGDGNFRYTFKPNGYNEIANSGKELMVAVLPVHTFDDGSVDYTTSNIVNKRLIGHAALNVSASQAMSINSIDVTWNALEGASGYYVSSRQYDLTNTNAAGANTYVYVSGNSYTLTNQSDDIVVQGYPYRFVVIPVINASDMSHSGDTYTLKEGGEEITFGTVSSIEDTAGYAISFAVNVTASKGTYASSGNVNDRIQITWEKPFLLKDAGLQYRVYRKAYNSNTWENLVTIGEMSYIDNPTAGVMYEYVVGLLHHVNSGDIRGPSRPDQSSIFIASERAKVDNKNRAKFQGFIQNTVTMNNVTRGEDAAINAVFGEQVTWNGSGIAYGGSDVNYGVDGYTVYVMNRNINANWHVAADNVTTNTILLTPSNTPSVNNTVGVSRNLLFVLRDYKHFFKARSYAVRGDGTKIYSPDPAWTYSYQWGANDAAHITASNNMQNDFVKWGARQVTTNEFVNIAMLYVARGFNRRVGNGWSMSDNTTNASTSRGGSGSVQSLYNHEGFLSIPLLWTFTFHNYKDDLEVRTGEWMTFVRLTGQTRARVGGSTQFPQRYWTEGSNWVNVFGPATVADGLYKGRLRIGTGSNDSATNIRWNDNRGRVLVEFPLGSAEQNLEWLGSNTPLPFTGQGDDRYQGNNWR